MANTAPEAQAAIEKFQEGVEAAANAEENLATALGLLPEELKNLQKNLASGSSGFFNFGEMIGEAYKKGGGGLAQFTTDLQTQIVEQGKWADNLQILAARGATSFVSELAQMGPDGAQAAADAVNLTTAELDKLEDNARLAAFLSSEAFAQTFTQQTPVLIEAYRQGGLEAVTAMIAALREGTEGKIKEVVDKYNLVLSDNPLKPTMDVTPVQRQINELIAINNDRTIRLRIQAYGSGGFSVTPGGQWVAFAGGGHVRGRGSATSDSIPARLSNGEYVIKASSVRQYGTGLFDQLNRGVARFASGGYVRSPGAGYANGGSVGGNMNVGAAISIPSPLQVELSPMDRRLIQSVGGSGDVYMSGQKVTSVVNDLNASSSRRGQ